ncbi:CHAT domain-containing protein [Microtetraspora malaysiensis]|uniref:CHAT domain-containing protein n=1 Tax=Microtetraspora malaysiensis TaxID=161358 RepID=UPI000A65706D|nr:CHAT domain-containing protein [Microtetraspora malaysiensis]
MMAALRLEAQDVVGLDRWCWTLTGADGRVLARHDVRLNPDSPQYEASLDLLGYLQRHAAPDLREIREEEIVRNVGEWLVEEVLGPVADALCAAAPAAVQVVAPTHAPYLQNLPLELAWVRGRPLALQDVTLVWQCDRSAEPPVAEPEPPGGRPVRVLALFSLPESSRTLNLRRERQALYSCFTEAARTGRGVEFRSLQYGVTRKRLQSVLARPEGWDLIHVSGHGTPGELLLETETGQPDRVSAGDLVELLVVARGVRLVTLSACWSAAAALRVQHRLLELPDHGDRPAAAEPTPRPVGALANLVADRLGCAVLAMRYPVTDDFAIDMAERLYPRMILDGHPLPKALAGTLKELAEEHRGHVPEALQAATPTLVGARAAELAMVAPHILVPPERGEATPDTVSTAPEPSTAGTASTPRPPITGTPPVPARFVGRVALMAWAGAALSPHGDHRGVLLSGMPGVGKTTCAAELVLTHEHAFENVVWFQVTRAQEPGSDSALAELALIMEQADPGLRCVELLTDADRFVELPALLGDVMRRHRLLLVIDGIDPLLDHDGDWQDQRWRRLLDALAGHEGAGRLILTGRSTPRALPPGLLAKPIGLLTHDESMLLTRELPNLARLVNGNVPCVPAAPARRYARALLESAQGHPQLLELANGLCSDPSRIMSLAEAARGALEGAEGDDRLLRVIRAWTRAIVDGLPTEHRDLFLFLCCLDTADRIPPTVEQNWPELRAHLGHGEAPLRASLQTLVDRGLVTPRSSPASYDIQPAIAAVGRDLAGDSFRTMVDLRLAGYWVSLFRMAWDREGTDADQAHMAGPVLARAGLSAVPYLARRGELQWAEVLLEAVLRRDTSMPTIARVHPLLRWLATLRATTTGGQPLSGALDLVLKVVKPQDAERQARLALERARSEGDHSEAATAASRLIELVVSTGRLEEAIALADEQIDHVRLAGLGVWSRLHSEVQRVHVLAESRYAEQALTEAAELRRRIEAVPRERTEREGVLWWEVWEELHESAQRAAIRTANWQQALQYTAELCRTKEARGAPATELAKARFPAYMPLAQLGRTDEALLLLDWCRARFSDSPPLLGEVLGALGNVEHLRGHGDLAIARAQDALRYAYLANIPSSIAIGHANLGTYLHDHARDSAQAAAHHLVAALLGRLTSGVTTNAMHALAGDLHEFGRTADPATDPDRLSEQVGTVPGVDLHSVLRQVAPDPALLGDLLTDLVNEARRLADQPAGPGIREAVWAVAWEPVVAALVAAARGNTAAYIQLRRRLTKLENLDPQFAKLAAVLRRIHDGERGPRLLAGLGPLDAAVATRAQDALENQASVDIDLWPAMHFGIALANIVATATGHPEGADATQSFLDDLAGDPDLVPMAEVLTDIVGGSRDSGQPTRLNDPTQRAVIGAVLHHISKVESANGSHPGG